MRIVVLRRVREGRAERSLTCCSTCFTRRSSGLEAIFSPWRRGPPSEEQLLHESQSVDFIHKHWCNLQYRLSTTLTQRNNSITLKRVQSKLRRLSSICKLWTMETGKSSLDIEFHFLDFCPIAEYCSEGGMTAEQYQITLRVPTWEWAPRPAHLTA
jgi:hypothetical protein